MTAKWLSVMGGFGALVLSGCASHNDELIRASRDREAARRDSMTTATRTSDGMNANDSRDREVSRTTSTSTSTSTTTTNDTPAPALTAMDQSNDPEDIRLTSEIRKLLMDDSQLSFSAKNVKIISRDRRVTLRGSVTSGERAAIVSRAKSVAGVGRVDDMLEVK